MFKNRWVQGDRILHTKDDAKHGNGAIIYEENSKLHVHVYCYMSDRCAGINTIDKFNPETIDKAKLLAEMYIGQLMELGE